MMSSHFRVFENTDGLTVTTDDVFHTVHTRKGDNEALLRNLDTETYVGICEKIINNDDFEELEV